MQNKQTLSKPLVVMLLAGLCCLLWGSAIPFINLGYRYFGVTSSDTATQILFGGCRFFLAGFLTILFESVARKSPAFPKKTSRFCPFTIAFCPDAGCRSLSPWISGRWGRIWRSCRRGRACSRAG